MSINIPLGSHDIPTKIPNRTYSASKTCIFNFNFDIDQNIDNLNKIWLTIEISDNVLLTSIGYSNNHNKGVGKINRCDADSDDSSVYSMDWNFNLSEFDDFLTTYPFESDINEMEENDGCYYFPERKLKKSDYVRLNDWIHQLIF
jgi:hypothetical protein